MTPIIRLTSPSLVCCGQLYHSAQQLRHSVLEVVIAGDQLEICSNASAAIQRSLSGIGVPARLSCDKQARIVFRRFPRRNQNSNRGFGQESSGEEFRCGVVESRRKIAEIVVYWTE